MVDYKKLKVPELKAELSERGLSTTGKKDELVKRLLGQLWPLWFNDRP